MKVVFAAMIVMLHSLCLILTEQFSNSKKITRTVCESFIIISTLDGHLTAVDMNSGKECWSVLLDPKKFFSSTLSNLEIYEKGQRVWLVPSLDGSLFKYHNMKLQPLPMNVDALISHSAYIDEFTSITGGKLRVLYGINLLTGEVIYACEIEACFRSKISFPEHILIVEEFISFVSAIDATKVESKWNFRVADLKLRVPTQESGEQRNVFFNDSDKYALISTIYRECVDFDLYKISLQYGFAGMMDKESQIFSWIYTASSPISDAWCVNNNAVKALDPFNSESRFFSVDIDHDESHSALLFLGFFENQFYVKKSKKLILKTSNSLSTRVLHQTQLVPVNQVNPEYKITDRNDSHGEVPKSEKPKFSKLNPSGSNIAVSEYGSYFYINYSVAENWTHCIVNTSFVVGVSEQNIQRSLVFGLYAFTVSAIICMISVPVIQLIRLKNKQYINDSISSVESSEPLSTTDSISDFKSRFHQDFELLAVLGRGGFGVVLDVKNKIDDCRYAVKRIPIQEKFKSSQYEKVLREVKALAKLDHCGIVRYFNAWIEYPPVGWQEAKDSELNIQPADWCSSGYSKIHSIQLTQSNKEIIHPSMFAKKLKDNPLGIENSFIHSNKYCHSSDLRIGYKLSKKSSGNICVLNSLNLTKNDAFVTFDEDIISSNTSECLFNSNGSSKLASEVPSIYSDFSSKRDASKEKKLNENTSLLTELEKLDRLIVYSLKDDQFNILMSFLVNDASTGQKITETSSWTIYLRSEDENHLVQFQRWIISVLCFISSSKHSFDDLLVNSLCFILCDLNKKLDSSKPLDIGKLDCSQVTNLVSGHAVFHNSYPNDVFIKPSDESYKQNISISSEGRPPKIAAHGFLYIQMQLCKKESLQEWLNRHCVQREYAEVISIFEEIINAVDYVHNCGLMHRDLKPSNIYFSMEGAIKIGDFGLATSSDIQGEKGRKNKRLSDIHTSDVGTEFYMSPEQKLKQDYDYKTDIYSLGIILFELLVPFQTQAERIHALKKVRRLEFPGAFKQEYKDESTLVEMMLSYNSRDRPSTREVKEYLLLMKPH